MNRGLEKRVIFRTDNDRVNFLDLLGEISEIFGVHIHAYSLMSNHYHLLVHTPRGQLGRAMRHLNGLYTQNFNKSWNRDGPLFRGRYKAVLADETRLFDLIQYIHLNPVAAGIVNSASDHEWTSHLHYLNPAGKPAWLVLDAVAKTQGLNPHKYRSAITTTLYSEPFAEVRKNFTDKKTNWGRRGFQDWLYANHVSKQNKSDREFTRSQKNPHPKPSAKNILGIVATAYNKKIAALRMPSTGKREDRSIAILLLRQTAGLSHKQIARWMKLDNPYAVAKVQQRIKSRIKKERRLEKFVRELKTLTLSTVKT